MPTTMKILVLSLLLSCFFFSGAAVFAGVVYHGTTKKNIQLIPMHNTRYNRKHEVIWEGEGVFATVDLRIALVYTSRRLPDYHQGVDLINKTTALEPVVLYVSGGSSKEEALEHLYGTVVDSVGYIYVLDDSTFTREPGLGQNEVVSRVAPTYMKSTDCPDGFQTVNPRKEIEKYVSEGRMKVNWEPEHSRPTPTSTSSRHQQ